MHLRRFDSQRRSVRTWPLSVFLATYLGAPVWLNPQMALGDISVIERPLLADNGRLISDVHGLIFEGNELSRRGEVCEKPITPLRITNLVLMSAEANCCFASH